LTSYNYSTDPHISHSAQDLNSFISHKPSSFLQHNTWQFIYWKCYLHLKSITSWHSYTESKHFAITAGHKNTNKPLWKTSFCSLWNLQYITKVYLALGQHYTTSGHYFQCWLRLTVNICLLYHEINATNLCCYPWRSNIEYVLICLLLQSDQNIDANAWCHVVYTLFPGNMDHVMTCSPGTWRCTDENGQHCLFLHIMWRLDLRAAQSSIFGSARNFFSSLSQLEPKITDQQQSWTQSECM